MNRNEFTNTCNRLLKIVRTEYGLTQDEMAVILGISKKTLVESEKGRRSIGWTEAVALSAIFAESHVLQNEFGGDTSDILKALAFEDVSVNYPKTMGGKVWWRNVVDKDGFVIQQNLISQHFRLLDQDDRRLYSSFDLKDVEEYLDSLNAK